VQLDKRPSFSWIQGVDEPRFAPHLLRDRFRRERSSAAEALCIVCLSGPAAEQLFFGPIEDDGDKIDQQMARRYLPTASPIPRLNIK
jgi:hypothetical protein